MSTDHRKHIGYLSFKNIKAARNECENSCALQNRDEKKAFQR